AQRVPGAETTAASARPGTVPARGAESHGPTGRKAGAGPPAGPLLEPREGVPPVGATAAELARVIEAFAAGTGPVAVDAERASGYRYGQRAYLSQRSEERRVGEE